MNMENKIVMIQESIKVLTRVYMRRTPMLQYQKEKIRIALVKLWLLYTKLSKQKSKRRMWVRPIYSIEQRFSQGDSDNLVNMLRMTDPSLYFNYLRMEASIFKDLLLIVGPGIEKQLNIREPIASYTRLQICLRYLASGDSMKSVGYT